MILKSYTGGHQITGRTRLLDVALFTALQTWICEICIQCHLKHEKLKPHWKNGQITTNDKHFTVENVRPPYPSTLYTCEGCEVLQNLFFLKIATILHLSYSLEILIKKHKFFWFTNGELQLLVNDGISDNKVPYQCHRSYFMLIVTLLRIIWCDMSGKYT